MTTPLGKVHGQMIIGHNYDQYYDEHHFFLLKTVDLKNKELSCPSLFRKKATFIRSDAIVFSPKFL